MSTPTTYRIGIDVGTHSVGFAAIEMNGNVPCSILSAVSLIHDSGVDPDENKQSITRLAKSGVARRTRRMYRRRRKRMIVLEEFLTSLGWPTTAFEDYDDPYLPWKARAELATRYIDDAAQRNEKLSIAIRHIANHRGWRNPYNRVSSLYSPGAPSDNFEQIRAELQQKTGLPIPADATVGQMISFATFGQHRLRGGGKEKDKKRNASDVKSAVISARLHQKDHAREINEICAVQGLDDNLRKKLIDHVFASESPKGAQVGRVGKDPLQPQRPRALKASDAFQQYRIASLIGNLRLRGQGPLTTNQKLLLFDSFVNADPKKPLSWIDVAKLLEVDRSQLLGTATLTDDFERAGNTPPTHQTNQLMAMTKVEQLRLWWADATPDARDAMIKSLSNAEVDDWDSAAGAEVHALFTSLTESEHSQLDGLHLPIGRAAYSEDTLRRLTKRMLENGVDLHTARQQEFGIPKDWRPPAPTLGEPVGNPAVDRVIKAVARFVVAADRKWGAPQAIVLEHVRSGFMSEARTRELERDNKRRHDRNQQRVAAMHEALGIEGTIRSAGIWRYQSIQRQNGQCAYCGAPITYHTAEMDHIVPQAGPGSTNTRDNLVAVCRRCNLAKKNVPFATWAETASIPGVSLNEAIERTRHWTEDNGLTRKQFSTYRNQVVARLRRTSHDEPLDNRSLESVAWMANELHARLAQHFAEAGTSVEVYRGQLTHEARKASGISSKIKFVDGTGKSRLDRRHHAVDAAVISMTTPYVAEVLAQRINLRDAQRLRGTAEQWKEFTGEDLEHRAAWSAWKARMQALADLLQLALANDDIVVMTNKRLSPGNSRAHEDTISPLLRRKVGDALPADLIDRASSEALWCALTRHPGFDDRNGLPEDSRRSIRIHGTHLDARDTIEFFDGKAGAIRVRGGSAEISRFHHARIYKITAGKKSAYSMLRVYDYDLRRHRNTDVFSVDIPPQTMSMRQADPKLRKALADGTAEYLGWLVPNDEIIIEPDRVANGSLKTVFDTYGPIRRWVLKGFYGPSRLTLYPLLLSAEGLPNDAHEDLTKIIDKKGFVISVNPLFANGSVTVVRRTTLGEERWMSSSHLPICWESK